MKKLRQRFFIFLRYLYDLVWVVVALGIYFLLEMSNSGNFGFIQELNKASTLAEITTMIFIWGIGLYIIRKWLYDQTKVTWTVLVSYVGITLLLSSLIYSRTMVTNSEFLSGSAALLAVLLVGSIILSMRLLLWGVGGLFGIEAWDPISKSMVVGQPDDVEYYMMGNSNNSLSSKSTTREMVTSYAHIKDYDDQTEENLQLKQDILHNIKSKEIDNLVLISNNGKGKGLNYLEIENLCNSYGIAFNIQNGNHDISNRVLTKNNLISAGLVRYSPVKLYIKWMLDFLLAISMLVVLSPALLVVAILIKLTSTGPIFFKHTRYGFYGKQFELYKFRTMYENAHKDQNKLSHNNIRKDGLFKMKNDPRVTKFGLFLRKTSIDELPSLVNVIRGEIGFIGPRAYSIKLKDYKDCQRRRLSVLPGMTCLTQAYDRNSYSNFIEKDLHYLDSWSPRLDIQIFFKTISTVLHGTGE